MYVEDDLEIEGVSQSPQIGASCRTDCATKTDELDSKSQSPQIGASCRTVFWMKMEKLELEVSIPSNRGVLSDPWYANVEEETIISLNPLKSGRPVGHNAISIASRTTRVSIPSNRGVLSDFMAMLRGEEGTPCLNPLKSGRPVGLLLVSRSL